MLCNDLKVLDYWQVLRAYLLALTARDTIGRFAEGSRKSVIIVALYSKVFAFKLLHIGVVEREIFVYRNVHRTTVNTISTACAGNYGLAVDHTDGNLDYLFFLLVQGSKLLHKRGVVKHLFHIAHSRKHEHYVVKACGEAYSPRGNRHIFVVRAEELFNVLGNFCKRSALYGLHDDNRHIVLYGYLIALARLYALAIPVEIVYLKLNEVEIGMLG